MEKIRESIFSYNMIRLDYYLHFSQQCESINHFFDIFPLKFFKIIQFQMYYVSQSAMGYGTFAEKGRLTFAPDFAEAYAA